MKKRKSSSPSGVCFVKFITSLFPLVRRVWSFCDISLKAHKKRLNIEQFVFAALEQPLRCPADLLHPLRHLAERHFVAFAVDIQIDPNDDNQAGPDITVETDIAITLTFPLRICSHLTLNGFVKKMNEKAIVTAFLAVVTVAASGAPHVLTKVSTNCIPKYPDKLKRNAYPYVCIGYCRRALKDKLRATMRLWMAYCSTESQTG